jgi:hypothetical protein
VKRLETILYLQKNRFMPLSVIKEELERGETTTSMPSAEAATMASEIDSEEIVNKLHAIDRVPELLGVSVTFVKQLAEAGVITLQRSPHGRDLVDGKDFALIRTCEELRRFGIGPKNLRQYVQAANRESGMFEQALTVYGRNASGGEARRTPEQQKRYEQAFTRMIDLTNSVRSTLIRRSMRSSSSKDEDS